MGAPFEMALPPAAAANLGDAFHNAIAGQLTLLKRPSTHSSGGQRFAQFSSLWGCEGWQPARKAASSSATRCALTKGAGWGYALKP